MKKNIGKRERERETERETERERHKFPMLMFVLYLIIKTFSDKVIEGRPFFWP